MIEHALKLAREGFHVFPGTPNAKAPPLISDFPNQATRDEEQIKKWWDQWPSANPCISTTRFGDNEALVVVDVDVTKEKKGLETAKKIKKEFGLPNTKKQITPSGGFHFIYRHSEPLRQGTNTLGPGVDIRSRGGYIVGAGSRIGDRSYSANDVEIAHAPSWLVEKLGLPTEKEGLKTLNVAGIDEEIIKERAVGYLTHAPEAIEGAGGDFTTFKVASRLKDLGCSEALCLELMTTRWFDGCGWSTDELAKKIQNAFKYGKSPQGVACPEAYFDEVPDGDEGEHPLDQINKEYALTYIDGGQLILHETVDEKGRFDLELLSETAFHKRLLPHKLSTGEKTVPLSTEWMRWPKRREYQKMVFAPEVKLPPQFYNTWRGFRVKPVSYEDSGREAREGFDAWKQHAFENICSEDKKHFDWLMGFFAQMVQHPSERPLVDLTLIGGKGTGKNAFIERIGNLLQRGNFLLADNDRYILSNFNAHLERCLLFVLDEAVWAGDKKSSGIMKGMTTKPTLLIERKGCEAYEADNLVRVVRLSNESWVVDASEDERRTAVFELKDGKKQNRDFFHRMRVNIDAKGGNAILLHYLKTFDLATTDVDLIPETGALLLQKDISLSPIKRFWQDALEEGQLYETEFSDGWQTEVARKTFKNAYFKFCRDNNPKAWKESSEEIARFLAPYFLEYAGRETRLVDASGKRVRSYKFKSLAECRDIWDKTLRRQTNWED